MAEYFGIGNGPDYAGPLRVYVSRPGREPEPLVHRERHSPDGFQWGYGGSGPADLARSLLWDLLGYEPEPALYQAFKRDYVATWPQGSGECWRIDTREMFLWVARWQAGVPGQVGSGGLD